LRAQLAEAESALKEAQAAGSPKDGFTKFVIDCEATDDSSDELKKSQLRRWLARIDLSSQKLQRLLETTIPADSAERLYGEAKRIVSQRLDEWVRRSWIDCQDSATG
jgi:hypothetical protein